MLHQHRIIIYTTCYNVLDGVTLTIRKLEQEILAAGHFVCILTTRSGDLVNTHLDGQHPNRRVLFMDNAIPIPFVHDPNNPDLSYQLGFSLSRSVQRQLNEFEPTLIHITVPDCTALHLIEYARRKEIPIMGTYHSNIPEYMDHYPGMGWLKPILGGFFRHQYNFLQALYVPTPFIRRHLTDTYQLDRATRLGIWGRGVDVERFHPDHRYAAGGKFRAQLGLEDDDVLLCWVGRLVPEKRVDIFCDTVRRLDAMGLRFHAIVVGAGPCEEEVKALPHTTFCGWMNGDQLAVAYASSDIFLFPSAVETFGNVTLEAMASGLPVVVEGGCSGHLVEEGVNGFACLAGDSDAFFEATATLVQDHAKRLCFSSNSRAKAEQLEKHSVVRRMLQNYQAITDEFYADYGGHHANRDKEYTFVAGNHPRPIFLVMVELLFIVLFQVLWNMSQLFLSVQDSLLHRRGAGANIPLESSGLQLPAETIQSHPSDVSVTQSASPLRPQDDKPEATPEVETSTASEPAPDQMSGSPRTCRVVDVPTAMASSFIRTIEFVCRLESCMRNCMSSVRSETLGLRKRKKSYEVYKRKKTVELGSPANHGKDPLDVSGNRHGSNSSTAVRSRSGGSMSASTMKEFLDVVYRDPSLAPSSGDSSSLVQVV
ncbi:hypothetical protein ACA910_018248 [Epithemia clementina (nom. ined.)]